MVKIYKFTDTATPIEDIVSSKIYQIAMKINNKEKLTRIEKDYLYDKLITTGHSEKVVPVFGWYIDFSNVLQTYLINYKYEPTIWREKYALDKTSIRSSCLGNDIKYIIKFDKDNKNVRNKKRIKRNTI